jgi:DNA-binding IclR family transcriptional regulator
VPRNDPIQSITRSIRILFAVAGAEDGRSLEQIARLAGLKSATAYRMIRTLEQEGMLARTVSPLRFVLGSGVAELKQLDDERHLLTVASRVLIRTQARLPQGNFNLVERIGIESCERIAVNSTRPGVAIIRRTSLHDPYAKVSSLLFLAYADPLEQQAFFKQHPFERDGIAFWENSTRLHGFLSDIRRRGYAYNEYVTDAHWFRVACPIFSPGGDLIATAGAYLATDASARAKQSLIKHCRQAAREISGLL